MTKKYKDPFRRRWYGKGVKTSNVRPVVGKDYSLNTNEVFNIIDAPCHCVLFEDICHYEAISELFPSEAFGDDMVGRCLINYLYTPNYGHWVGLCLRIQEGDKKPIIEYFDPYGSFIDGVIDNFPDAVKIEHNSDYPYLLKIIYSSGDDVYYNHYPLQAHDPDVATCGRWVGYFLRNCGECTIDQFGKSFMDASEQYNIKRDELITELTNPLLED